MEEYISKSALVAEIERRATLFMEESKKKTTSDDSSCAVALYGLLPFLNTLEVKEVDFIKEFYTFSEKHKLMDKDLEFSDIERTASFFFQLGLKVQKGE